MLLKGKRNLSFGVRCPKGLRDVFYGCGKVEDTFKFCDLFK